MATLTYGSAQFPGDNTPAGIGISNLQYLTFTQQTSTYAAGDYRKLGGQNVRDEFWGTGLTANASRTPTGGTLSTVRHSQDGTTVFELGGLALPVTSLVAWSRNGQEALATQTVFAGNDQVRGTAANDTLEGYAGDDLILGNGGNDVLIGDDGNDTLVFGTGVGIAEGGAGSDTAVVDLLRRQAITKLVEGGVGAVTGADISVALTSVEEVRFIDGTYTNDPTSVTAQAARLYQAAFGRAPDSAGLGHWVETLRDKASLTSVAREFIGSTEFQSRYGTLDNGGFVARLFKNVLGRGADQGGLEFWKARLESGAASRADELAAFSESDENLSKTASLVTAGLWAADEQAASVARLYDTTLGRKPDAAGLTFWTKTIQDGATTLEQMANAFIGSSEFTTAYGTLNNADFVALLYRNVLDRPGENGGETWWTGRLDSGAVSRSGVVLSFSESAEHRAALAGVIEDGGIVVA